MKRTLLFAFLLLVVAGTASALEPQTTDQFGNPEEPAMRPYKWIFHGIKGLLYQPGKSFVDGNMNLPVLGTVEVTRGARRGVVHLGESTWNGVLYRTLPEKDDYKKKGEWNESLEDEEVKNYAVDATVSIPVSIAIGVPLFPIQMLVDKYPAEDDEKVALRQEEARKTREARRAAREWREEPLTDLERAQRHYIGDRATEGGQDRGDGGGNLLKRFK